MFNQRKIAVHQQPANLFLSNLFYNKFASFSQLLERKRIASYLFKITPNNLKVHKH